METTHVIGNKSMRSLTGFAAVLALTTCWAIAEETPASDLAMVDRFHQATESIDDDYLGHRAVLIGAGREVLEMLQHEASKGSTAHRRALAAAMIRRIEAPTVSQRLDNFEGEPESWQYRNPYPFVQGDMVRAFAGEAALAYERLATRSRDPGWELALSEVIMTSGDDAREHLIHLTFLHAGAAGGLVALIGPDAGETIGHTLERTTERGDRVELLRSLGTSGTRDERALTQARQLFRDSEYEDVRTVAAVALGELRDRMCVEDLFDSLLETDGRGTSEHRREVTVKALSKILGPQVLDETVGAMVTDDEASQRRIAAYVLGKLVGNRAGCGERLAILIGDRESSVRVQALRSMSTVGMVLNRSETSPELLRRMEDAVLVSLGAPTFEERGAAVDALWRLVGDHREPASPRMKAIAAGLAIDEPDERIRLTSLFHLKSYLGREVTGAVVLMLEDLGRLPRKYGNFYPLKHWHEERSRLLSPEAVRRLLKSDVPALQALTRSWTSAQGEKQ